MAMIFVPLLVDAFTRVGSYHTSYRICTEPKRIEDELYGLAATEDRPVDFDRICDFVADAALRYLSKDRFESAI